MMEERNETENITDILITKEKLDAQAAIDKVSSEYCGANSIFIGTTRDIQNGRHILKLEYEGYELMAKKEMLKICDKMRKSWPEIKHIVMWHRLGSVPVKEASVIIAVSSPHRIDSMSATQQCMDTLKAVVPIWKQEVYTDGTKEWKENKECGWNKENSEALKTENNAHAQCSNTS
ncbi:molybdopterin synthase catalytic subunit 1-like [Clavelina lepadiformis]|uniref:Molybdopterin synthase catalytic subunit n=1 Tax=Clavelina lepadiformis TaxID=159417 RepID=A0ABP0FH69_CLALP